MGAVHSSRMEVVLVLWITFKLGVRPNTLAASFVSVDWLCEARFFC